VLRDAAMIKLNFIIASLRSAFDSRRCADVEERIRLAQFLNDDLGFFH